MKTIEDIYDLLKVKFGDAIIELVSDKPPESYVSVEPLEIDNICSYLKADKALEFN